MGRRGSRVISSRRSWLAWPALWLALGASACGLPAASADAVPPPPRTCPTGQVGITDHRGARCVERAPTNCPAGWIGELGGKCVLHVCTSDDACGKDKQCREIDACLHEWLQEWGEAARPDPFVLAAPPHRLEPPIRRVDAVDVCQPDRKCPIDSTCGKAKVCLPVGVKKAGAWKPGAKK